MIRAKEPFKGLKYWFDTSLLRRSGLRVRAIQATANGIDDPAEWQWAIEDRKGHVVCMGRKFYTSKWSARRGAQRFLRRAARMTEEKQR